ncbi:hypothetical protein ACHQM5_025759 [Ranunculus cassubicifolius]
MDREEISKGDKDVGEILMVKSNGKLVGSAESKAVFDWNSNSKVLEVETTSKTLDFELGFLQSTSELIPRYGPLMHSLHTSSSEDEDDFSELDLPPTEKRFNSLTERPSSYTLNVRKAPAAHETHLQGKSSNPKIETEDHNKFGNTSITIENVPVSIGLDQLKKAVLEFGEISDASIRSESVELNSCDVEFKSTESKERAMASGGVIINLHPLPIRSPCTTLDNVSITIRIRGIGLDTPEPALHSMCASCGNVKRLVRTKESSIEVVFGANKFSAGEYILDGLNAVCAANGWLAELVGEEDRGKAADGAAGGASQVHVETGLELAHLLEEIHWQTHFKKIYTEDLVKLHHCVVHLQNRPACSMKINH